MDAIAGSDGTVVSNPNNTEVLTRFEQSHQKFGSVFNATQTYCNGGSVPSELTDQPAS